MPASNGKKRATKADGPHTAMPWQKPRRPPPPRRAPGRRARPARAPPRRAGAGRRPACARPRPPPPPPPAAPPPPRGRGARQTDRTNPESLRPLSPPVAKTQATRCGCCFRCFAHTHQAHTPQPCIHAKAVKSICRAARVPIVCTYSMRGLYADMAVESYGDERIAAKLLGHTPAASLEALRQARHAARCPHSTSPLLWAESLPLFPQSFPQPILGIKKPRGESDSPTGF